MTLVHPVIVERLNPQLRKSKERSSDMPEIEYFYATHSAFAYLGSQRFIDIAAAHGRTVRHRPMLLRPVMEAANSQAFATRTPEQLAYFFGREIERWSEYRGAPTLGYIPKTHASPLELSSGLVIAAVQAGHSADALAHEILARHWQDDVDLGDQDALAKIVRSVGLDPSLLDQALSDEVQAELQENTSEAARRSVFGSPTYFVDGDMFYGQDRLELMDRALSQPFAPPSWRRS